VTLRSFALVALLFTLACSGKGDAEEGDSATPAGDDTAVDTDTDTEPPCSTVNSGDDWAWNGECPQMRTPVAITVTECALALDYESVGGMTMGMPYTGTVDGDQVTFGDDNTVTGCVGTVETEDKITGSCADGCTFTLRR
jgi:hypothetical protein